MVATLTDVDLGVRRLVTLLNANGFETCDSGDGISKTEAIAAGDAMAYPNVFITVAPEQMVFEATRLLKLLEGHGVRVLPVETAAPFIQANYDPVNDIAILGLFNVDDYTLGGAPTV